MRLPSLPPAPFYVRLALVLISLYLVGYLLILGKDILSPLIFSFLFSILLLPLAGFFERKLKLPRSAAAGISVIIMLLLVVLLLYFVGAQISGLASDWPTFKQQVSTSLTDLQAWVTHTFHIDVEKQWNMVNDATSKMLSSSTEVLGTTVVSVSSIVLFLVFVMIDTFFLLLYRRLIMSFMIAVFKEENAGTVFTIIEQVQYIIRKYILGILLEMAIVAAVCSIAFEIVGIKYALLLGVITGLFNIIPYIGIFTALLLSTLITFATAASTSTIIAVAAIIIVMHLIDSNILLPVIVGSRVKINAFITLLAVVVGEKLWGISGMFLSVPVVAIFKIIFDNVKSLNAWGMLLGEEKDLKPPRNFHLRLRRPLKRKKGVRKMIDPNTDTDPARG
jgi:predicted PurR-regulated permease PerM